MYDEGFDRDGWDAEFIQDTSPRSALRFINAVEKTGEHLVSFPESGALYESEVAELQGIRIWQVLGFEKYLVVYRIRSDELRILRVIHGHRDLPQALKEGL